MKLAIQFFNLVKSYWVLILGVLLMLIFLSIRSCVSDMNKVNFHPKYVKVKLNFKPIEHENKAAIDSVNAMPDDSLQGAVERAFRK